MRDFVIRTLRIPPKPEPPPGDASVVEVFRAAPNFYRYRIFEWFAGQIGALLSLLVALSIAARIAQEVPSFVATLITIAEVLGIAGFVLQIPFTFAMLKLDYEFRWYMISDRALRIREGVLTVDEKTMTFANIQNLSVRQGPIQRLLGIADLEVRTAGGGSGGESGERKSGMTDLHLARFRGVANAPLIRETILARLRRQKDTGLGDPDDSHREGARGSSPDTVSAAAALLDELRRLRPLLSSGLSRAGNIARAEVRRDDE